MLLLITGKQQEQEEEGEREGGRTRRRDGRRTEVGMEGGRTRRRGMDEEEEMEEDLHQCIPRASGAGSQSCPP